MNSLQRVRNTINREAVDHIPVYPFINAISRKYCGYDYGSWSMDTGKCARSILKTTDELGLDIVSTQMDLCVEAADWGLKLMYPADRPPQPAGVVLLNSSDAYGRVKRLRLRHAPRMSAYIQLAKQLSAARGREKFIMGYMLGPLGVLSLLRGVRDLFYDILTYPEKVREALENIGDTLAELALGLIEAGCHGIMINVIYTSELFMNARMWETFEGLYVKKISRVIKEAGGMVFLQSTMEKSHFETMTELIRPETIAFLSLPDECVSMKRMKELYGSRVTLMGHIDPGFLTVCSEAHIREQCRRQIDAYKAGGGYILATGYEYPDSISDRYARIMAEEAAVYGAY
jgi:uroporphyrinogen decarboxylase